MKCSGRCFWHFVNKNDIKTNKSAHSPWIMQQTKGRQNLLYSKDSLLLFGRQKTRNVFVEVYWGMPLKS